MFLGIIVALSLLPAIAENHNTLTTTRTASNVTYTSPALNGVIDLEGQELIGTALVTNATGGTLITSNVTVDEGVSATTGLKTVQLTVTGDTFGTDDLTAVSLNVSYTYGPEGYADSQGARGMAGLIVLFAGLGLMGFVVFYSIGKARGWM